MIGRTGWNLPRHHQPAQQSSAVGFSPFHLSRHLSNAVPLLQRRRGGRGRRRRRVGVGEIARLSAGRLLAPPRSAAAEAPPPARVPPLLFHQITETDGRDLIKNRIIGGTVDRGGDVQDADESAGGAADLHGGEGRGAGRAPDGGGARRHSREARAEEEAHGADEEVFDVADGEDLDGDGGGLAGDEFVGDAEEELVVPGRVFAAE